MFVKKFTYLAVSLAIILVIIAGAFAIGYRFGGNESSSQSNQPDEILYPDLESFKSISGVIKDMGENYIVVEGMPITVNPFTQPVTTLKRVIIDSQTKIYQQRRRESGEITGSERQPGMPPLMFVQEEVSRDNLEVNDNIIVHAQEDIKGRDEFVANTIIILMAM